MTSLSEEDIDKKNVKHEEVNGVHPIRFRPNLVISGSLPYAEDNWKHVQIGRALFIVRIPPVILLKWS